MNIHCKTIKISKNHSQSHRGVGPACADASAKLISTKLTRACLSAKVISSKCNSERASLPASAKTKCKTYIIGKLGDFRSNLFYPYPPLELYRVLTGLSRVCTTFATILCVFRRFRHEGGVISRPAPQRSLALNFFEVA